MQKNFFEGVYDSFNNLVSPRVTESEVTQPLIVDAVPPPVVKKELIKVSVKIVMIGDDQTGKSALLHRWAYNKFNGAYSPTTGAELVAKEVNIDDKKVTVQVWDTSGQERFQSLGVAFYRGSDACIIVCDYSRGASVDHLEKWREDFIALGKPKDHLKFPFIVIGNKSDMDPESLSLPQRIQSFCNGYNIPCFFTSAKDGTWPSIDEAFMLAVKKSLEAK